MGKGLVDNMVPWSKLVRQSNSCFEVQWKWGSMLAHGKRMRELPLLDEAHRPRFGVWTGSNDTGRSAIP